MNDNEPCPAAFILGNMGALMAAASAWVAYSSPTEIGYIVFYAVFATILEILGLACAAQGI